ncbi:hypothetical protein C8N24_2836 [Solirubrobacter pauli]|uniref:Uncharacterized protein n=1 Tax=Solirubrobacter pauli TaxID=166793 RepID=A0A660LEH6_9ACTN|nr:hypothetical protein [Solirubrobacter pauli]RKQ92979.1 hypothetical protein C8N24_2836 [Solirubrobacter pauli]
MSAAGERRQLGRYELPDGTQRILCAQRINGRVAISDVPDADEGRVYLVERHVESRAAMQGLVDAYIEDAMQRGEPAALAPTWAGV